MQLGTKNRKKRESDTQTGLKKTISNSTDKEISQEIRRKRSLSIREGPCGGERTIKKKGIPTESSTKSSDPFEGERILG